MSYYVHEVPGRLRIKMPALRRNPKLGREIETLLRNFSGITYSSVNSVTGSVLVNYDTDFVTSGAILNTLAREGYIDLRKALPSRKEMDDSLANTIGQVASKALISYAIERVFEGTPLSIVAAFI
jgi:hypothetical protein